MVRLKLLDWASFDLLTVRTLTSTFKCIPLKMMELDWKADAISTHVPTVKIKGWLMVDCLNEIERKDKHFIILLCYYVFFNLINRNLSFTFFLCSVYKSSNEAEIYCSAFRNSTNLISSHYSDFCRSHFTNTFFLLLFNPLSTGKTEKLDY